MRGQIGSSLSLHGAVHWQVGASVQRPGADRGDSTVSPKTLSDIEATAAIPIPLPHRRDRVFSGTLEEKVLVHGQHRG